MQKPLSELVAEFLSEQDTNEATLNTYHSTIDRFVRWVIVEHIEFWKIKRSDLIQYKAHLTKRGLCMTTIDLYLTVVRKLFKWLENRGLYDNIAAGIHSPKRYRGHRKGYLNIDQINQLLSVIDRSTVIGARDYAIISLMVRAGLRCVEVSRLSIKDLQTSGSSTLLLQRKGHLEKDCTIGITSKLVSPLEQYLSLRRNHSPDAPMFVSHARGYHGRRLSAQTIGLIVKSYLRRIGIDDRKITGHSLRHTAAILSLKAGATINEVQQMLGHSSIETTKIYLSAIDEETRLNNPAIKVLDTLF